MSPQEINLIVLSLRPYIKHQGHYGMADAVAAILSKALGAYVPEPSIPDDGAAEANARAAAPELLAACREAIAWPDEDENGVAWDEEIATPAYRAFRGRLRAAVAKAEGRS